MDRFSKRTKNRVKLLQEVLQLTTPSASTIPEDIVLIAIDFENHGAIKRRGRILDTGVEVGLAILDTRDLTSTSSLDNIISTYNFAAGSTEFGAAASCRLLFGKSSTIETEDILRSINGLVSRSRSIILIGYELKGDLLALRRLKFDLQRSIYRVIDTASVTKQVLPSFTGGLEDLLNLLKCPFENLHCAGNDAHFNLRVLLLLATLTEPQSVPGADRTMNFRDDRVTSLKGIAYHPIPNSEGLYSDAEKNEEQKLATTTKAVRKRINRLAGKERQKALSTEEKERSRAAYDEEKKRSVQVKQMRLQRAKRLRDTNYDAQRQVQEERIQRGDNYHDLDLDSILIDFLS